jgi:hypothetical protein
LIFDILTEWINDARYQNAVAKTKRQQKVATSVASEEENGDSIDDMDQNQALVSQQAMVAPLYPVDLVERTFGCD